MGSDQVYMTNFGASFKRARESKGISISKIAQETRISSRFLEAIENEEFHLLPGGIFNRGFIRTYAEHVGLDADAALSEYEQLIKTQEPEHSLLQVEAPAPKSERNFYPIAIGALVLAIIIFYIVTRDSGNIAPTSPPPESVVSGQTTSTPLTPSVSAALELAPGPTNAVALDIEVREQTWIKVIADRNDLIPGELLEPGMTRRFTAQTSLTLTIGNAAGLTMKLNGQKVKPLGKSGQVREIIITPDNLKDFIG